VIHGDATVVRLYPEKLAHIIDFGVHQNVSKSDEQDYVEPAIKEARDVLENVEHIDVFITHFHRDHYYYLHEVLKSKHYHRIYVPTIPRPTRFRQRLLRCLACLIAARVPDYEVLENILSKPEVRPVARGSRIIFVPYYYYYIDIIWPPRELPPGLREKLTEKIDKAYSIVEGVVERDRELKSRTDRVFKKLWELFTREPEEVIEDKIEERGENYFTIEENEKEKDPLTEEEKFKKLKRALAIVRNIANQLSLIIKAFDNRLGCLFLIPGDVPKNILDYLWTVERSKRGNKRYWRVVFLRAAHHGTEFGDYLKHHEAIVLWTSWNSRAHLKKPCLRKYIMNLRPLYLAIAESVRRRTLFVYEFPRYRYRFHIILRSNEEISGGGRFLHPRLYI